MALLALIVPALAVATAQESVPPFDQTGAWSLEQPPSIERRRAVAPLMPSDARLVVDAGTAAPLASRSDIAIITWPHAARSSDFVLLDRDGWSTSDWADRRRMQMATRVLGEARPVLADDGPFRLFGPVPASHP